MLTRTKLMQRINAMMTAAGASLTEDQDAVLAAALGTLLVLDSREPCPVCGQQVEGGLRAELDLTLRALRHTVRTYCVDDQHPDPEGMTERVMKYQMDRAR